MEAFWSVRDPEPRTARNEMRDRWQELGGGLQGDPRALLFLLNGPPGGYNMRDGRALARCFDKSTELEIWFYRASERTDRRFIVIFRKTWSEHSLRSVDAGRQLSCRAALAAADAGRAAAVHPGCLSLRPQ